MGPLRAPELLHGQLGTAPRVPEAATEPAWAGSSSRPCPRAWEPLSWCHVHCRGWGTRAGQLTGDRLG